ncbi:hypothetical protein Plhal703r1_c68g0170201 [Plasmopara halstedii]
MDREDYGQMARAMDEQKAEMAATSRGLKRESSSATKQQRIVTQENWSTLSNVGVAGAQSGVYASAQILTQSLFESTGLVDSTGQKLQRTNCYVQAPTQDENGFSKASLSFILGDQAASTAAHEWDFTHERLQADFIARSKRIEDSIEKVLATNVEETGVARISRLGSNQIADGKRRARRPPSRVCKHEGCEQYVVDQGLCVRHGGGKRCLTSGCTSRAKHQGRCWKHGGSTECKVPSCINRAKSRGFCWSHGGGTKCKVDSCEKIAISNALCWAHGGGKRCAVEGCMRQAYERTENLCNNHYQERQHGTMVAVEDQPDVDITWIASE